MFRTSRNKIVKASFITSNQLIPLEPRLLMSAVIKATPKAAPKPKVPVVVPVLTLNDIQVTEPKKGASTVTATVALSAATKATVSFHYATSNVTALANKDYKPATGTVTIKPGLRGASIKFNILSDKIKEPDEVFNVIASKVSGATLARPFSRVVIRDAATIVRPNLVVTSGNVQAGQNAQFTVTLSRAATAPVTFRYTTTAGSANTSQFRALTAIATIPTGHTSLVLSIPTTAGSVTSGSATFKLTVSSPSNANLAIPSATATVVPVPVVVDNSGGNTTAASATIAINDTSSLEGNTPGQNSLIFTVTLSTPPVVPVTVQYATGVDLTDPNHATPGVDYTDVTGTLTFGIGQTTQTIAVPILGNTIQQGNRDVLMTLTNPTSATFFRSQAVGTILDDDSAAVVPSQADFNGDGLPDLLFRNVSTGVMTVWYMNGTTRIGTGTISSPGVAFNASDEAIGTGDFNRDGHPDIVFKNTVTGAVTVWAQGGTDSLTTEHVFTIEATSNTDFKGAAVGDFNNDGFPDILFRDTRAPLTSDNPGGSTDGGKNMVWVMNGFTHVSTQFLPSQPDNSFRIAGVGDYDGDGNLDVYFHNASTGDNTVMELDGAFNQKQIVDIGNSGADTTTTVIPRDVLNLAGTSRPDLVFRDNNSGQNQIWTDSDPNQVQTLPTDPDPNDQLVGSQTL